MEKFWILFAYILIGYGFVIECLQFFYDYPKEGWYYLVIGGLISIIENRK